MNMRFVAPPEPTSMDDPFDLPSRALLCDLYGNGTYDAVRFVQFDSRSNDDENDQRSHAAVIVAVPSSNGEEIHKIERNDGNDDDDGDLLPRLVVDSVPKAKHLNISSRILYPVRRLDKGGSQGGSAACTYAVGRITHKDYKPVRVEVTFAEGRRVERFDQAEVRPFITPWSWIETRRRHRRLVPRDSVEALSSSSSRPGVDVVAKGRVGKSVRFRKGELRSTATGEVQKYNGKQWRRICAEPKCWKEVQKFGFCSRHMEENLKVTKSGKKKKQNSDATTTTVAAATEASKESASAAPPRSEAELEVAMAMSMLERPVVLHGPSSVGSLIPTAPPSAADASDRESVGVSECGGGLRVPSPVARNVDSFGVGTPPCTPLQPMPPYYWFSPHSFVWCSPYNY